MKKHLFRNVYEWQLLMLAELCGTTIMADGIAVMEDKILLINMNVYLRQLNCITFTEFELNTIKLL